MLPEMHYIESELLPMLRERAQLVRSKIDRQLAQWRGEPGVCCHLLQVYDTPEQQRLPVYNLEEIHYDPEKMFVNELRAALSSALADGDAVPSVRANVGCACLCTLYGGLRQTFFPDKMPWLLKHLTEEEIRELTAESLSESSEFKTGLEQMHFMKQMLEGTGIEVYPMDLQGPIDMGHLLIGDDFFYNVYDDPDLIHKVLELSLAADIYGMEKCFEVLSPVDHVCHYNNLVLPASHPLKISEDTSTLLGAEHLKAYMLPYTERLLAHFGGGYIHYCGDNRHLLSMMPRLKNSIGLNFGNPERHDAKSVFADLAASGKCYYGRFPGMTAAAQACLSHQEDGRYVSFVCDSCPYDRQEAVLAEFAEVLR